MVHFLLIAVGLFQAANGSFPVTSDYFRFISGLIPMSSGLYTVCSSYLLFIADNSGSFAFVSFPVTFSYLWFIFSDFWFISGRFRLISGHL